MHPRRYQYSSLSFGFLTVRVFVFRSDNKVLALVACQGPAEGGTIEEVLAGWVLLNPGQVFLQI